MDYIITKQCPLFHTASQKFAHARFQTCRSDLDNADKNAAIIFDKYEICMQDIRKKYMLGTFRIKQNLKIYID